MHKIDLTGTWRLYQEGEEAFIEAPIPGDIYSAHWAAGMIPDPFYGKNEEKVQWLRHKTWTYTREFEVDANLLENPLIYLHCAVLDTITRISVNGQLLGTTDNMFRRYRLNLTGFLHPGTNTISITFPPVEPYTAARAAALPHPVPYSGSNHKIPHFNQVRKIQCHAGWDWGICLITAGIYRDISIAASRTGRIEHVTTSQDHSPGECRVTIFVEYTAVASGTENIRTTFNGETRLEEFRLRPGKNLFRTTFSVPSPQLWWPRGYGKQPLYELKVETGDETINKKIGLREVKVNTSLSDGSASFQIEINGQPVFCKGANWIPIAALPGQYNEKVYEHLIKSMAEANGNMLRVWGGGQYEEEIFYSLCDELGIMVWQDFMFACSLYPGDEVFLENVHQEAVYQINRLKDHPCLVLWCGDNEIQLAFHWYPEVQENGKPYFEDYHRLNQDILRDAVNEHDPQRFFWSSSPANGQDICTDNTANHSARGDIHYWEVWHKGIDFSDFHKVQPHFCSEFGFQSYPCLESVKSFAPPDQWRIDSEIMQWHQRSGQGNLKIREALDKYFGIPEGFEETLWLSQVMQGEAISKAVEYWRTLMPSCMGVLYWQLNDLWPVSSWSSIEYSGRWKLLHYFIRRAYSPLAAIPLPLAENKAAIYLVNDSPADRETSLHLRLYSFKGEILWEKKQNHVLTGMTSFKVEEFTLPPEHPSPSDSFLLLELEGNGTKYSNIHFFAPYKECRIEAAVIEARITEHEQSNMITLQASRPAFFLTLESGGLDGKFSDNGFWLLPDHPREIRFLPSSPPSAWGLKQKLQIISYGGEHNTLFRVR